MNIRAVHKSRSNISVKLPTYAVDKRLAFVESVCESLIIDRFGPFFIYEWSAEGMRSARQSATGSLGGAIPAAEMSEPGTTVTAALERAGSCDVSSSQSVRSMKDLRGTATSKSPVTIVPGSDMHRTARPAAPAKDRSSPATRYSSTGIFGSVADVFARLFSIRPRGSPPIRSPI